MGRTAHTSQGSTTAMVAEYLEGEWTEPSPVRWHAAKIQWSEQQSEESMSQTTRATEFESAQQHVDTKPS